MTQGTRTPAQIEFERGKHDESELGTRSLAAASMHRAEEIASDVRALAATVAELKEELEDWTHLVHARLNTHSQMISKAGTDCDICEGRGWSINVPSQTMYPCSWCKGKGKVNIGALEYQRDRAEADADDLEQIRSRVLPQSPESAEAAPEPVCQCGHGKGWHNGGLRKCNHMESLHPYIRCGCERYAPAEQAVQEPPALDPVLVKSINELCDLVDWLAVGTVHMIGGNACGEIHLRTAAIRAYGGEAREGGK